MNEEKKKEEGFKFNPTDKQGDDSNTPIVVDDQAEIGEPEVVKDEPLFNWSAPDSFSTQKSFSWYFILLVITVVLAAAVYLLTKDKITTAVIIVGGLLFGIYGAKKPKTVNYQLTKFGFTISGHYHRFADYRSFSIVHHGEDVSAVLTPMKRFVPYTYVNFKNDLEDKITSTFTEVLPKQNSHNDTIDTVLRKIGF